MKRLLFFVTALIFSLAIAAQGNTNKDKTKEKSNQAASNSDKAKGKDKVKEDKIKEDKAKADKAKKELDDHNKRIWEGTSGSQPSKNQPAKVRQAFQRDYPNATNVYWTKYRGDWTATFGNGIWRSTAIYHANGERKDTRTPVTKESIPRNVIDSIFKRHPDTKTEEAVKIELPRVFRNIFRVRNINDGKTEFEYYDADGKLVKYDY
jgi:hypothetical protein